MIYYMPIGVKHVFCRATAKTQKEFSLCLAELKMFIATKINPEDPVYCKEHFPICIAQYSSKKAIKLLIPKIVDKPRIVC